MSSVIVCILSTCILVWLVHRKAMAAHYDWFKLRLYKQFRQLMRRKTMWCMVALSTTSAFMMSFSSSVVFVAQGNEVMALFEVCSKQHCCTMQCTQLQNGTHPLPRSLSTLLCLRLSSS